MSNSSMAHRGALFLLFLLCGFAIWFFPLALADAVQIAYRVILSLLFLLLSIWLRRDQRMGKYSPVFFAFFIAAVAAILAAPFAGGTTVENRTFNIVVSTLLVSTAILLLTRISGDDFGSIYLKRGSLRLGLVAGTLTFVFFLVTALPASELFGAGPVTLEQLVLWAPYIAVFIVSNAIREELWLRGIFLRKYEAHLGKDPSNLLQAVIFGAAHLVFPFALYLELNIILFVMTFLIGLACGALMQKTDSVLASVIFHAGSDIPFLIAAFYVI